GNYSIPAARLAGEKGKVYAVDRNENVLGRLKERIALEKLRNIEIIDTGGDVKLPIAEGSVDFVLLLDVLHSNYFEVESRKNLLGEICRVLNKNGLIILFPKHMENENFIEEIVKSGFIYKGKYLKTLLHDKNYEEGNIYIFQRAVSQE
ncbi:MAG TPA: class I SAM-dependent methyltransferase, partial [bacterium]|nr:class I SAM-dependent methyltransferase [bacterium]